MKKYIYVFGLDTNKGFKETHPELIHLIYKGLIQIEMTEAEFINYRIRLQVIYNLEICEISRQECTEPENVL